MYSTLDATGLDNHTRWVSMKKDQSNMNMFHSEGLWEIDMRYLSGTSSLIYPQVKDYPVNDSGVFTQKLSSMSIL